MHTFIPQTRRPFDFHKKKGVLALLIGASVATFLGLGGMQANKGGIQLVGLILEVQDQTKGLVFGMVHIKDSLLPMGKVWSLDSMASYFSFTFISYVMCPMYRLEHIIWQWNDVKCRSLSYCKDIFHFMNKPCERDIENDGLGGKKNLAILWNLATLPVPLRLSKFCRYKYIPCKSYQDFKIHTQQTLKSDPLPTPCTSSPLQYPLACPQNFPKHACPQSLKESLRIISPNCWKSEWIWANFLS